MSKNTLKSLYKGRLLEKTNRSVQDKTFKKPSVRWFLKQSAIFYPSINQ